MRTLTSLASFSSALHLWRKLIPKILKFDKLRNLTKDLFKQSEERRWGKIGTRCSLTYITINFSYNSDSTKFIFSWLCDIDFSLCLSSPSVKNLREFSLCNDHREISSRAIFITRRESEITGRRRDWMIQVARAYCNTQTTEQANPTRFHVGHIIAECTGRCTEREKKRERGQED